MAQYDEEEQDYMEPSVADTPYVSQPEGSPPEPPSQEITNEMEQTESERRDQLEAEDKIEQDELDTITWGTEEDDEFLFGEDENPYDPNSESEQDIDELIDGTPDLERRIQGDPAIDDFLFGGVDEVVNPAPKRTVYSVSPKKSRPKRSNTSVPPLAAGFTEDF